MSYWIDERHLAYAEPHKVIVFDSITAVGEKLLKSIVQKRISAKKLKARARYYRLQARNRRPRGRRVRNPHNH